MTSIWTFLLIFSAIACGWLLGRFAVGASMLPGGVNKAYRDYFRGLNYLLNDRPDEAIDTFLATLEVTKETLDTHIALGNLMRRKGDVERAIRIHHNLLARPQLPPLQMQRAKLELARDYISAGLFDRAEQLLRELVQEAEELRPVALRHLIEIYQSEREWTKAIETATRLLPRRNLFLSAPDPDPELEGAIAHFHCELAQAALDKSEFDAVRAHIQQALIRDAKSVRASLLLGMTEYRAGNFQAAIDALQRIPEQNAALFPEALDTLRASYDALGRRELVGEALREALTKFPSTRVALAVAEEIGHRDDADAAAQFLLEQMRARPTLRGIQQLMSMQHSAANTGGAQVLRTLLQKLTASKPTYQCASCGFSGRQMHWQCPKCKQWNTFRPIVGSEGD